MTLDEAIKRYTNNAEYEHTHGNLQGCLDFGQLAEWLKELKQLKEQMSNSEKPNKWIPISKEVPKEKGWYITTTMFKEVYCDYWNGIAFERSETVLAWMPLPLPWKAESEE